MRTTSTVIFLSPSLVLSPILGCESSLPEIADLNHRGRDEGVNTSSDLETPLSSLTTAEKSTDKDEDGIENSQDNCPDRYNPNQEDTDRDTVGDICDLRPETLGPSRCQDIDGLLNETTYNGCLEDTDNDTVPNYGDLCHWVADEVSEDGIPVDSDEDLVPDACDRCPDRQAEPFADFLGKDQTIKDTDEDGVDTSCDNCPEDSNTDQQDLDEDGVGDICDHFPEEWGHERCDRITGEQQTRADSAWCGQDADGDGVPNGGDREPENADVQ